LKKVPNAQALLELSKTRSEDATKLAKETWDDILKVLQSKADKAKELAEGTKEEAKKEATKEKK
jgi:transcription initiation factor IIF auxiliary subunit